MDVDDTGVDRSDAESERITVVGVSRGDKVKHESEGKVLWAWRGDQGEKEVIHVCFL